MLFKDWETDPQVIGFTCSIESELLARVPGNLVTKLDI